MVVDDGAALNVSSAQQRFVAALQVRLPLQCLLSPSLPCACVVTTSASLPCVLFGLQAALHAAAGAGLNVGGDEHRWDAPGSAEAQSAELVLDPATRMFWRNVHARVSRLMTPSRQPDNVTTVGF